MNIGLYYFNKRSNMPKTVTPVRVFTTSGKHEPPIITIIDADGKEIPMSRGDAVVTYLALGVALKTTKED